MPRVNPVAVDSENEARLRAYLDVIPTYLLRPGEIDWMKWICGDGNELPVFLVLYEKFGVDENGDRLTQLPDREKRLRRRWCTVSNKKIADSMWISSRGVARAVENLKEKGLIDVTFIADKGKEVPHYCMNWDRVLEAVVTAVRSRTPSMEMIFGRPELDAGNAKSQPKRQHVKPTKKKKSR